MIHSGAARFVSHGELSNYISNDFDVPMWAVRESLQDEYNNYLVDSVGDDPDASTEDYGAHAQDVAYGGPDRYICHLRDSICKEGMREPLTVSDGRLIEGHHRAVAAMDLKMRCIPVLDCPPEHGTDKP